MTDRAMRAIAVLNDLGWDLVAHERPTTCGVCETRLVPTATFCHQCGTAIVMVASPTVADLEAAIAAANQEPTA